MTVEILIGMYLLPIIWMFYNVKFKPNEDPVIKPLYLSAAIFVIQMFWITYQRM